MYNTMDTATRARVEAELEDLKDKTSKLESFIYRSKRCESLRTSSQELLRQQLEVMKEYAGVLSSRLKLDNYEERENSGRNA